MSFPRAIFCVLFFPHINLKYLIIVFDVVLVLLLLVVLSSRQSRSCFGLCINVARNVSQ